ncbi:MAG: proteasome activator [Acidimicrobiales bacterium]
MSDVPTGNPNAAEPVAPELVTPTTDGETEGEGHNNVAEPAKVMRVGTMIRQLLDEVRQTELDGPSRDRLREIYETSIAEIGGAVSPDLREELDRLALPFGEGTPTDAELRIAQAQLVGWLEGLFHGIQATLFAQQMAARNQLEDMRRQLPPGGQPGAPGDPPPGGGTYL